MILVVFKVLEHFLQNLIPSSYRNRLLLIVSNESQSPVHVELKMMSPHRIDNCKFHKRMF
jgi:hypothetical protein